MVPGTLLIVFGKRDRIARERNQLQRQLAAIRSELRKLRLNEMAAVSESRERDARAKALSGDLDETRRQCRVELMREMEAGELKEAMLSERAERSSAA